MLLINTKECMECKGITLIRESQSSLYYNLFTSILVNIVSPMGVIQCGLVVSAIIHFDNLDSCKTDTLMGHLLSSHLEDDHPYLSQL